MPHLFNTQLSDRVLWYDGDVTVTPEQITTLITKGYPIDNTYVSWISPEISKYNKLAQAKDTITTKTENHPLSFDWMIGPVYQQMDVETCVFDALEHEISGLTKEDKLKRIHRTEKELKMFKQRNFNPILRLIIYIIDQFEQKNVVWGVGRGSSVSSYVLYLIGLHDIDSVKFNLPIEDFLR